MLSKTFNFNPVNKKKWMDIWIKNKRNK
jgi:hypothetical protein